MVDCDTYSVKGDNKEFKTLEDVKIFYNIND